VRVFPFLLTSGGKVLRCRTTWCRRGQPQRMPDCELPPLLICEDDPDDLFFARLLVQRSGAKNPVITVEDGEHAITYLTGCIDTGACPCLVLLDIKMPLKNGFDVLEWARGKPELSHVAFVVMSGSALEADRERAYQLGAKGYLVKYPSPQALGVTIRQFTPELKE
jgi:CheY-like chemotaxis protein